jgi:hypothetical protein
MIEEMEIKMRNLLQEVGHSVSIVITVLSFYRFILAKHETSSMTSAVLMILKRPGVRKSYRKNSWVSSNDDHGGLSTLHEIAITHVFLCRNLRMSNKASQRTDKVETVPHAVGLSYEHSITKESSNANLLQCCIPNHPHIFHAGDQMSKHAAN